jgi:hypothetical protein
MQITYPGPHASVDVPSLSLRVARGEQVDVPDDVGAQLVEQGWQAEPSELESMTVAQLRDLAAERRVEIESRATKAEILAALAADKEQ